MKRSILSFLILCVICPFGLSAQKATDILDKAAASYEKANGISAVFTINIRSNTGQNPDNFDGTIQMKGDKFTLVTPDVHVWYDGSTQWTYMEHSEEVNVTTPTGEELQFTNPALLLNMYKKGYTAAYKGEGTATNAKAAYNIELTPTKKGSITKIELQVEKSTYYPAQISVTSQNGYITTIQIGKLTTGLNQPDNFFHFKEADFPNAEIIDLR